MNEPLSALNPFADLMKPGRKLSVNLNRSCCDSVVPLTDRSNWVTFDDDSGVIPDAAITHGKVPQKPQLAKGDQVVATCRIMMTDPSYLRLEQNEVVEVLTIMDDGLFMGCSITNRSRTGIVNSCHVRRLRTNSVVGLNTPVDGPFSARIDRKESTVLPRRPANLISTPVIPDYMNTEVTSQSWYMGEMDRQVSEIKLRPTPNGTFLVRFSKNRGRFALSISYEGDVKHTVVEQSEEGKYFLDEGYVFSSIVELVNYYKEHNLCESFNSLNTVLRNPYRECRIYRVLHDFEQSEPKFLSIKKGEVLTLLDTVGEERGWWKGQIQHRVGFFPMSYVEEVHEDETR